MRGLARVLVPLVAVVLTAAGCASSTGHEVSSGSVRAGTPKVTKLLVVVMENHSLSQMKSGMPYTFGLAQKYGYATSYYALRHPSLPNYIAITGGAMYGITDDKLPPDHRIYGHSVFGQARAHGKTAATYAESMPTACSRSNHGRYVSRHNPWTYFVKERHACLSYDRTLTAFAGATHDGRLPRVGMLVPNLCNDAHDCGLATADTWFRTQMQRVFAGPDWKSGHLAVVLTADEDDHNQGNKVLTVVIHPSQLHHVVSQRLNHYSLTRLYDEVAGLPKLRRAADASSMAAAFGLPVG
jgi:acid phosphatase